MKSLIRKMLGPRGVSAVRRLLGGSPPAALPTRHVPPEFVRDVVTAVENDPAVVTRPDAMARLRKLGLDDFAALLLLMPDPVYPKLSRLLPAMAGDDVQVSWTGASGMYLLKQTLNFVRSMAFNYVSLTGRPLSAATVLDFGCGYGRIARLMYYFVDEPAFFGVDPWQKSIDLCNAAGLTTNFLLSDYLPTNLPVGETRFDLIYAFSVFTHLSERAALAALTTLRKYVTEAGLLVITIRPIEYWAGDPNIPAEEKAPLENLHRSAGFAFRPHARQAVDGDITYGDTSLTLPWLAAHSPQWSVRAVDRSIDDSAQIYVFLQPV